MRIRLHLEPSGRTPAGNADWVRRAADAAARAGRARATPEDVRRWLELEAP
ncbi:MAG: hypothetical protein PHN82_04680 [bacterium]|nr:hypothetical protein [bacterium]